VTQHWVHPAAHPYCCSLRLARITLPPTATPSPSLPYRYFADCLPTRHSARLWSSKLTDAGTRSPHCVTVRAPRHKQLSVPVTSLLHTSRSHVQRPSVSVPLNHALVFPESKRQVPAFSISTRHVPRFTVSIYQVPTYVVRTQHKPQFPVS